MSHLLQQLSRAGATWTLHPTIHRWTDEPTERSSLALRMTIDFGEGDTCSWHFAAGATLTLEQMAAVTLKRSPAHAKLPLLQTWLRYKGNVPVKLAHPQVLDCLPEAVHTALRKCADSKQSVISWNAIHHLHPLDLNALWTAIEQHLKQAVALPNGLSNRRRLAQGLKDVVIQALDKRYYAEELIRGPERRKDIETFALRALHAACELTELSEWMYGWLGFVFDDVPEPLTSNEPTPASSSVEPKLQQPASSAAASPTCEQPADTKDDLVVLVATSTLVPHCNPFEGCWPELKKPLTFQDVQQALDTLADEPYPQQAVEAGSQSQMRQQHARKVAWLVKHGFTEPLQVDVGVPSLGCVVSWLVQDGNHRLAAAVFRRETLNEDPMLPVAISGSVDYAIELGLLPRGFRVKPRSPKKSAPA